MDRLKMSLFKVGGMPPVSVLISSGALKRMSRKIFIAKPDISNIRDMLNLIWATSSITETFS